jgi:hypothetical protein
MAEDWAQSTAKKIEGRIAEEAERAATLQKRYEEGIQRFRKQLLDLVMAVNAHIATDANRIHTIVLHNGIILSAAYKRIVTVEEAGAWPEEKVPACVGRVLVERENRKAPGASDPDRIFVTAAGTQTAFYQRTGQGALKQLTDADVRALIEYFTS